MIYVIPYKTKEIYAEEIFAITEEVIDVFCEKNYILTIEKVLFHIAHARIIGSMKCGKTRNYYFVIMHQNIYKVK